ncbi:MAG: hypothetical protein CW694_04930 [Candidatus Syntrophoarchaeum sp. WYZ-LMO15]|nr:MAG: hypothetical protein CW694_04930 [Candidatus Syntrophoarchaeum sp. WYZ-LMO15]
MDLHLSIDVEEEGWDGSLGFVCACNTKAVTFGSLYVCKDGPVFSYARLKEIPDAP